MKVLILVDIQNDFLPGGRLPVPRGDAIIPLVNSLQEHFELVVATQDWHPPNHQSFASSHPGKMAFDRIRLGNLDQTLWPDHCVQETPGAAFPDTLNTKKAEAIFRKGTDPEIDSYSAFYDNGHLKSTGLAGYLRNKQVDEVWLAGLAGDICVFSTAMDSLKEGFKTFVIEDATRPLELQQFRANMKLFETSGGRLVSAAAILH